MIKCDWLSFVYKASDDDQGTYGNIFSAFLAHFPKFEEILDETVVVKSHGYYSSGVAWNDGVSIHWDDDPKNKDFLLYNGKNLDPWEHGVYVSFPAHGLHYLSYLLDLDESINVNDDFASIKPVFECLRNNNCKLSRLDICYDDDTKHFMPRDFFKYWDNNQVQSPCHSYTFCGSKGATFYVGCRANKILRIYDKEKESQGRIDAIRYEIECHQRYCNDIMDMILKDQFNFWDVLQKWFIRLKEKSKCDSLDTKSELSRLPDLTEWVEFISDCQEKSSFANNAVFPVHSYDVTMDRKDKWLYSGVAPSLLMFTHFHGVDALFDMISSSSINERNRKLLEDSCRIHNVSERMIASHCTKSELIRRISFEIDKAFAGS